VSPGHVADGGLVFGDFDQGGGHRFFAAEGPLLGHEVPIAEVFRATAAGEHQHDRGVRRAVATGEFGEQGRVATATGEFDGQPVAALAAGLHDVRVEQLEQAGAQVLGLFGAFVRQHDGADPAAGAAGAHRTAAARGADGLDGFRREGVAPVGGDVPAHAELGQRSQRVHGHRERDREQRLREAVEAPDGPDGAEVVARGAHVIPGPPR